MLFHKMIIYIFVVCLISSCYLPEPPKDELFEMIIHYKEFDFYRTKEKPIKNLLVIIADSYIQDSVDELVDGKYQESVNLEDVAWWVLAPSVSEKYYEIILMRGEQVKYDSIVQQLDYLRKQPIEFDIVLLSHGTINYLSSGIGYFLGSKDITKMAKFANLDTVFMQSCYGVSLIEEWHYVGAKNVIGFQNENQNFFYFNFFFRNYTNDDLIEIKKSYQETNRNIKRYINNNIFYRKCNDYLKEYIDEENLYLPPILSINGELILPEDSLAVKRFPWDLNK